MDKFYQVMIFSPSRRDASAKRSVVYTFWFWIERRGGDAAPTPQKGSQGVSPRHWQKFGNRKGLSFNRLDLFKFTWIVV